MTEKTSTPDQPDHHATVATDDQAIEDSTAAAGPSSPDGAGGDEVPAPEPTVDAEQGADEKPSGTAVSAAAAGNAVPEQAAPPAAAGWRPAPAPVAGRPSNAEARTTEVRLPPQANGTTPANAPSDPRRAEVATGPVRQPAVAGQRGPAPAPGPVPGPGPDAATPPPWHRVPGRAAPERFEQARAEHHDESPTTLLTAPRQDDSSSSGDDVSSDTGSWSLRAQRNRPPRQAALQLKRIDPWSALKLALVLAVVLFFVWLVAVGIIYGVLNGMGVWDRLNGTYSDLVPGGPTGDPLISAGRVFGVAAVIGAVNSLLFAVAITLGAFVYNVSADLVGGIEVTLSERD